MYQGAGLPPVSEFHMAFERYGVVYFSRRLFIECNECRDSGNIDLASRLFEYERADLGLVRIFPVTALKQHDRNTHHPKNRRG